MYAENHKLISRGVVLKVILTYFQEKEISILVYSVSRNHYTFMRTYGLKHPDIEHQQTVAVLQSYTVVCFGTDIKRPAFFIAATKKKNI